MITTHLGPDSLAYPLWLVKALIFCDRPAICTSFSSCIFLFSLWLSRSGPCLAVRLRRWVTNCDINCLFFNMSLKVALPTLPAKGAIKCALLSIIHDVYIFWCSHHHVLSSQTSSLTIVHASSSTLTQSFCACRISCEQSHKKRNYKKQ